MILYRPNRRLVQPLVLLLKLRPPIGPETWNRMYKTWAIRSLDSPSKTDRCQTFPKILTTIALYRNDIRSCPNENQKKIKKQMFINWANREQWKQLRWLYLRPSAWDFATECVIPSVWTNDAINRLTPHFCHIILRTTDWLLCLWIDVIDIRIGAHELTNTQLIAIDRIYGHNLIQFIHQN